MGWKQTFDDLFRSDASVVFKVIGGAAVGGIVAILVGLRGEEEVPLMIDVVVFITTVGIGSVLGAALSMKDLVERRRREGRSVPFVLRLFFGMGIVSLLFVWIPLAFLLTIAGVFLTLGT